MDDGCYPTRCGRLGFGPDVLNQIDPRRPFQVHMSIHNPWNNEIPFGINSPFSNWQILILCDGNNLPFLDG